MSSVKIHIDKNHKDNFAAQAADTLRKLALNEKAKAYIMERSELAAVAKNIAHRYVAGETLDEAIKRAKQVAKTGYTTTIDYMGESVHDKKTAQLAVDEFLRLITAIQQAGLKASISLDLSHIGSVISKELGLNNAKTLAKAAQAAGQEMMISMEGLDRTDDIIAIYEALSGECSNVGITIQARPHRTKQDLPELMKLAGRIRLVKGAYDMPKSKAHVRDTKELDTAYDSYARQLLSSGHLCSIATHDWERLSAAKAVIARHKTDKSSYRFEFLSGLGVEQAALMLQHGHSVQEYIVYGNEWWLYVLNRIAEKPERLFAAVFEATL
jgi:proline dehydrogenase